MHDSFRVQMKQAHANVDEVFPYNVVHERFLVLLFVGEKIPFLAVLHDYVHFGALNVAVFIPDDEVAIHAVQYLNFLE